MRFRSLLYRTDALFWRATSRIVDRGDYMVIDTPDRRGWYWGNCLIFEKPPAAGDRDRWLAIFREEFPDPKVQHVAIAWDDASGDLGQVQPFLDAGFELDRFVTLVADAVVPPPKWNDEVMIRELGSEEDFDQAIAVQVSCRDLRFPAETYTLFTRRSMETYRGMIAEGLGVWYGAFLDDRLVADLGLFFTGELGRFQSVGTAPEYRRRGICGTLVYEVSRRTLASGRATHLVMAADEEYHAAGIYESVGFIPAEWSAAIYSYPEPPVEPKE
jgi:hypothetical protein